MMCKEDLIKKEVLKLCIKERLHIDKEDYLIYLREHKLNLLLKK